jgi:hypothetical protein
LDRDLIGTGREFRDRKKPVNQSALAVLHHVLCAIGDGLDVLAGTANGIAGRDCDGAANQNNRKCLANHDSISSSGSMNAARTQEFIPGAEFSVE